ncbi:hypothetical protein SB783_37530 [Paraburkholderia sp. SIMBA_009]
MADKTRPTLANYLTNLLARKRVHLAMTRGTLVAGALMPALCFAQVSIASPAQSILQIISAGFAIIAGIGVIFCTIAGIFGFAQWTRLLNIIGWIVAGGGGLALATYAASLAV